MGSSLSAGITAIVLSLLSTAWTSVPPSFQVGAAAGSTLPDCSQYKQNPDESISEACLPGCRYDVIELTGGKGVQVQATRFDFTNPPQDACRVYSCTSSGCTLASEGAAAAQRLEAHSLPETGVNASFVPPLSPPPDMFTGMRTTPVETQQLPPISSGNSDPFAGVTPGNQAPLPASTLPPGVAPMNSDPFAGINQIANEGSDYSSGQNLSNSDQYQVPGATYLNPNGSGAISQVSAPPIGDTPGVSGGAEGPNGYLSPTPIANQTTGFNSGLPLQADQPAPQSMLSNVESRIASIGSGIAGWWNNFWK